jgi:predicted TPR repeat methyltransferase
MAHDPNSSTAFALLRSGLSLATQSRFPEALNMFRAATQADPACGPAWRHLGDLLRRAGSLAAASECFERAIAVGDDPGLNKFFLSAVGVGKIVASPPARFVTALFDEYADRFDDHLLSVLNYRGPSLLARLVGTGTYESTLDLGCGTGLAGDAFRDKSRRLVGVDLSERMLAYAAKRGIYDRLFHQEICEFLNETQETFDLVICCDVFIYLGRLESIFAAIRRVLRPHGTFALTVDRCDAPEGIDLLPELRYAHSERYVQLVANASGFDVVAIDRASLREQDGVPVEGLFAHLRAEA